MDARARHRHFGELPDRRARRPDRRLPPADGGLSAISYADRLYQLPGGVIVIATGSVLLKEMSMLIARGDARSASTRRTARRR